MAKAGKVYAAGSEDMDTLTFGSPILLRHLTFSEAKKMPISEISLKKTLDGLEFSMEEVGGPRGFNHDGYKRSSTGQTYRRGADDTHWIHSV